MGAGDYCVGPRQEGLGRVLQSGWRTISACVRRASCQSFHRGPAGRFGAISGLNRQSGIRNVSGRNNARYAITLSYAFLSFLLELSYFREARTPGSRQGDSSLARSWALAMADVARRMVALARAAR